ncbi:GGDEF domain-containing protein [Pseudoxanthobacter sp. M-2]|uniref:diguanylate cyclase domain-containing protein n=1 Tax=Pseudoxanthobacter sp. M-2 TaxID=3078754 RepID=UPI0038FC9FAC
MLFTVPTLFLFVGVSLLATGIAWLVAAFAYRSLVSARYWGAAMIIGAIGTAIGVLRGQVDPLIPVVLANGMMLFAVGLCWAGIRRFQGRPAPWVAIAAIVGLAMALLAVFLVVHDSITVRVVVFSVASIAIVGPAGVELLDRRYGAPTPGTRLTAVATLAYGAAHALRIIATVFEIGGAIDFATFNNVQALLLLFTVFGAQIWNAGFLMMAIDRLRAEVADLAVRDDLTGIANRRQFFERARQECARSMRSGAPLALICLDVDDFKPINDGHGHAAGDHCLQRFAALAAARLREPDVLARLGGDEFAILLPDTTAEEAHRIAEDILAAVRTAPITWRNTALAITCSAGAAEWTPDIGRDASELAARADGALYLSKQAGRDRVTTMARPEGADRPAPDDSEPAAAPHFGKLKLRP